MSAYRDFHFPLTRIIFTSKIEVESFLTQRLKINLRVLFLQAGCDVALAARSPHARHVQHKSDAGLHFGRRGHRRRLHQLRPQAEGRKVQPVSKRHKSQQIPRS